MWTQKEKLEFTVRWFAHFGITREEFETRLEAKDKDGKSKYPDIVEAMNKMQNWEEPPAPPTPTPASP